MVLRDFTIVAVDSDMLTIFVIVGSNVNTLRQPLKTVDEIGCKQQELAAGLPANSTIDLA